MGDSLLREWFPSIKKIGREYCLGGLDGNAGQSLKINLEKGGVWRDFAKGTGEQGDLVELYRQKNGLDYNSVGKVLVEKYNLSVKKIKQDKKKIKVKILPAPSEEIPVFLKNHDKVYTYRDEKGNPLFFFGRKNLLNGKKKWLEMCWSDKGWVNTQYIAPRPLYNLHILAKNPDKPVIFVEGEKAADACQKMVGDRFCVTTINGGVGGLGTVDFKPLEGRSMAIVWPDNDEAGTEYGLGVIQRIHGLVGSLKILDVSEFPEKGDAADLDWDYSKWRDWAKNNLSDVKDIRKENAKEEIKDHLIDKVNEKITQGSPQQQILWGNLGLQVQDGKIKNNEDNIRRIMVNDEVLAGGFFYDIFFNQIFTYVKCNPYKGEIKRLKKPVEYDKTVETGIKYHIQNKIGINRFPHKSIEEAIECIVKNGKHKNTLAEHFRTFKWDKKKRIDSFFSDYLGCPHDTIHYQMSANFFKMMVKRVLTPGCKSDIMYIFEGFQGQEKARLFSTLAGTFLGKPLYGTPSKRRLGEKEFDMSTVGLFLLEIGECEKVIKNQLEELKDYLTKDYDNYRRPYDKTPKMWERHHTTIGTTNKREYLADSTGERRFCPVEILVERIDIEAIEKIRKLLFAEAISMLDKGEKWWLMDKKEMNKIHQNKKVDCSIYDNLSEYCYGRKRVNVGWIMQDCFEMEKKEMMDPKKTWQIKECLIRLGYSKGKGYKIVNRKDMMSSKVSYWENEKYAK